MDPKSQRQKRQDNTTSLLDAVIEAMNFAKEVSSVIPAKVIFGTVSAFPTMIRDSMANKTDYIELVLACGPRRRPDLHPAATRTNQVCTIHSRARNVVSV